MLAKSVHQIAAVAVGHILGVRAHDDKARRAGFDLRHIAHPDPLAAGRGGRVRFGHGTQPCVQAGGWHTAVPHLMRFQDRFVQPIHPAARLARDRHQGCSAQLRQQAFEHLFQFGQFFLLFVFQIPFVETSTAID